MPISASKINEIKSLELNENQVALLWYNTYSGFIFKTPKYLIVVDPVDLPEESLDKLEPDIVFISHEHYDHYDKNSVIKLAKNRSRIVAPRHIISDLKGSVPGDLLYTLRAGETYKHGELELIGFKAVHPSPEPLTLIVRTDNDITIYHAIDSATFDDMKIVGEKYKPDIAIVPIGIAPRTSPREGARAVSMIKPKIAIPHHATGGFNEFAKIISGNLPEIRVKILEPGDIWIYGK